MNGSASPECELSLRAVLNWVMRTTGGAKDKHAHFSRNVEGEEKWALRRRDFNGVHIVEHQASMI